VRPTSPTRMSGAKLASPFLSLIPITGVAISIFGSDSAASAIHASDVTASRLEEIHFDLGEGPMFECLTTARPVLVPDVATEDRWPVFLSNADDLRVSALFLFPLTLGVTCVGAVLCYRDTPGALSDAEIEMGSALSRAISGPAFRNASFMADDEGVNSEPSIEMWRQVHQATGMVLVQLDTTATDAFAQMRAHAFSHGTSLRRVASDVVTRRLDFSRLGE
jgi:hypothetical protein